MFGNSFIPRLIIFGFLAFIPALALLWTPETASGQDSILPPHLYTGSVMLDSLPVADGVIVRALIGDLNGAGIPSREAGTSSWYQRVGPRRSGSWWGMLRLPRPAPGREGGATSLDLTSLSPEALRPGSRRTSGPFRCFPWLYPPGQVFAFCNIPCSESSETGDAVFHTQLISGDVMSAGSQWEDWL